MTKGDEVWEDAVELIENDIVNGFEGSLTARRDAPFAIGLSGAEVDEELTVLTSDEFVVAPWIYPCTHTGMFLGVPATYIDLDLRGTTFVDIRRARNRWKFFRYIDYVGALHQLGVSTSGRPSLSESQYDNWNTRNAPRRASAPARRGGRSGGRR
jgi:hypothetical protein